MKNKKKALARTVVVLCLCILCMTIAAMLTTDHDARNVITTGNIDIGLNVKQFGYLNGGYWVDDEGADTDYAPDRYGVPEELTDGDLYVMPGTKQTRTIQVKNIDEDAYIRVKLSVSFDQGLSNSVVTYETVTAQGLTGENWVLKDGWYYYKPVVDGGMKTDLLTANICFDPNMGDSYQGAKAELTIYAEAVQVANISVDDATQIPETIWNNDPNYGSGGNA